MRERETTRRERLKLVRESDRHRPQFTLAEKRRIFKQMVITELEGGLLRYSRRRALLRYAEDIGIERFDANLLIAEAQYRFKRHEPIDFDTAIDLPTITHPGAWPASYKLTAALIFAAVLDLVLIVWLAL
jgi:hypothetical protein